VFVFNERGRVAEVNPAAVTFTRTVRTNLRRMKFEDLFPPADHRVDSTTFATLLAGSDLTTPRWCRLADGSRVKVVLRTSAIVDSRGRQQVLVMPTPSAASAGHEALDASDLVDRIAGIVGTTWKETQLLEAVAEAVGTTVGGTCYILLHENESGRRVLSSRGTWPLDAALVRIPVDGDQPAAIIDAFERNEPRICAIGDQHRWPDVGPSRTPGPRWLIAIPITGARDTIGVLVAVRASGGEFDEGTARALATSMRHTAVALERNAGFERINRGGRTILGTEDIRSIVTELVEAAIELTHSDSGVIWILNEEGTKIVNSFCPAGFHHPAPRLDSEAGITRRLFTKPQLLEMENIAEHQDVVNPALLGQFASMVAVPLLVDQPQEVAGASGPAPRVLGVLYLNAKRPQRLTDQEKAFLQTLADQAAIAIQVRNSTALYHSLVDHIPQFVLRKDEQSRFTWANHAFCKELDLTLSEIRGKTDFDFYPPDIAKGYVDLDRQVMTSRQQEAKLELHPSGEVLRRVKVVKTPILDADGEVTGVQAIFWDVTEEQQTQERYRSLVEQSPDGIVIHLNGVITMANPAAVRLFGAASEKDLTGRHILDLVSEADRQLATDRLRRLHERSQVEPVEMRIATIGQRDEVEVAVHARPLEISLEAGAAIQVVFHDLTQVKRTLIEMHHRVNHVLLNTLRFLEIERAAHPEFTEMARKLRDRVQAMLTLNELLRRDTGDQQIPMKTYLARVVKSTCESYGGIDTVQVVVEPATLTLTHAMAEYCGFIVTELVSNALRHAFKGRSGGMIRVSLTGQANGHTELEVVDDGRGLGGRDAEASTGLTLVRSFAEKELRGAYSLRDQEGGGVRAWVTFDAGSWSTDDAR
jgi:PAS domain S-box-containing protein